MPDLLHLPRPESRSRHHRVADWVRRYGPAEVVGIVAAMLGSYAVYAWTGSNVAAAYGGSFGETLGFYGVIVSREIRQDRRVLRSRGLPYGFRDWVATAANLFLEFGVAEILDTLLLRPLAMGIGARYLGRQWGIAAGKLAADVTFYVPVILAYEFRRAFGRVPPPVS